MTIRQSVGEISEILELQRTQSPRQDSNLRQRLYKSRALPTELQGHLIGR